MQLFLRSQISILISLEYVKLNALKEFNKVYMTASRWEYSKFTGKIMLRNIVLEYSGE